MWTFLSTILGTQSPFFIWWVTRTQGKPVGTDAYGNRYFRGRPRAGYKYERRWVLYVNKLDSSSVPPEWHGWLHHQTDIVPSSDNTNYRQNWQKAPRPNMTGTKAARFPKAYQNRAVRPKGAGDYEAWTPDQ